jgi:hypothetical protein
LAYLSYGFSVIPILPGTKKPSTILLPHGRWGAYQKHAPTVDKVNDWVDTDPHTGVGIVCGEVSGNLYCLDLDSEDFSAWVETTYPNFPTWVERSGSGKLHIWLKSDTKINSAVMIGGGEKLADIRGDGQQRGPSYMVVTPTVHPLTNKPYETLWGSPEFVRQVPDALYVFDNLRDAYLASKGSIRLVEHPASPVEEEFEDFKVGTQVVDEDAVARSREHLEAASKVNRKVKRALIHGDVVPGQSPWTDAKSWSEVDHYCISELVRADWSHAEIYEVFSWCALRERIDRRDGSHGLDYIRLSIVKAEKERKDALEAASRAEGPNFKVVRVVRIGAEKPMYEVTVQQTQPFERTGTMMLGVDDLMDEHRFKRACMEGLNFLPVIHDSLLGRKFEKFGSLLLSMAQTESVPERGTTGGHLRATIRAFIDDEATIEEPEDYRMVTLGWRRNGAVFVRPGALLMRLQNVIYPRPKPEDVWSVLRALGGQEVGHRWPNDKREAVWLIPLPAYSSRDIPELP